jgi:hypothetical protein
VATNQTKDILADFLTLDLVAPSERRHPVSDTNEYWTLTTEGVALLKRIRLMTINDDQSAASDEDDYGDF